jgi:hypothetical protein
MAAVEALGLHKCGERGILDYCEEWEMWLVIGGRLKCWLSRLGWRR